LQLSVIIVNYNVKYFLEQCLCSVLDACKNITAEIFVIDNNSTDGSKDFLKSQFPSVHFIWNEKNIGFAKANNQGLGKANGKYILFLNPDTIVPENCFEKCISFLETHPEAGALGIRMIDGAGNFLRESKRAFPSPLISLYKLTGLARLFPHSKKFGKYHLGNLSEKNNHEVDVLAGAFMMLPKTVLNKTGGFDENFFMYGEDVDLSYRVQKEGYKNYYFAESTIIHFKGESTKKGSLNYVKMFYKAMSLFVKKHYGDSRAGAFNFLIQIAITVRGIVSALNSFFKRISIALLDALVILMSFGIAKFIWSNYVRIDIDYSANMLLVAFPIFSIIFLVVAYFTGLYDRGYKQSQLNQSTLIATLVLLSVYALLPESLRFSRGILILGIGISFILMSLARWGLVQIKILKTENEQDEFNQTVVVTEEVDCNTVQLLMKKSGMQERLLGAVNNNGTTSIGNLEQLLEVIKIYSVKEIIFCKNELSYKQIIDQAQIMPKNIRLKYHASGSHSIVGSDSKDVSGTFISSDKKFIIATTKNKRNKILLDLSVSIFFLCSFPLHIFLQKKPFQFFINIFSVLFLKKTWVGYATSNKGLPKIKRGIITVTTLPASLNILPEKILLKGDEWYAQNFSLALDIEKIKRGYKYLGYAPPYKIQQK
jgi:GT2 family glycosyltransferase